MCIVVTPANTALPPYDNDIPPLSGGLFRCVHITFHFMAFNHVTSSTVIDGAGASDNITREQIIRYTGYAVGATAVVGSVGVMTFVAPAQMALAAGVTAGCIYVADCERDGRDIVPSMDFAFMRKSPVDVINPTNNGDTQPVTDTPVSM